MKKNLLLNYHIYLEYLSINFAHIISVQRNHDIRLKTICQINCVGITFLNFLQKTKNIDLQIYKIQTKYKKDLYR